MKAEILRLQDSSFHEQPLSLFVRKPQDGTEARKKRTSVFSKLEVDVHFMDDSRAVVLYPFGKIWKSVSTKI